MEYPKRYSTKSSGIIIADVMIALALAALFVIAITALSLEAQNVYGRAHTRSAILSTYESHSTEFGDLMPYESRARTYLVSTSSEPVVMEAMARWYGNDRIQTDIILKQYGQAISFESVRNYPFNSIADAAGTPLCSPELGKGGKSVSAEITPIILPINPLLPLTDIEVRNGVAYVTADSSIVSDPDLLVIDINDPKNSRVVSSINTGPGLRSLAIAGKYIFAAAGSTAAQLHVIRLDSLTSLTLVKKYQLPMATPTTTPAMGSSVYYDRDTVYLGTEKWSGNEFSVISVANPVSPNVIGSFEVDSKINDIVVRNRLAYIATANQNQLQTIDVGNPSNPTLLNGFSLSGWQRQEGEVVAYFEDSLNMGRTSGGFDIVADHELFSWLPASSTSQSINIPGGVYGVVADRDRLYLATRNIDREFTVIDRSLATSSAKYYSLPVAPQAMTCDGDRLFILARNAPAIYEITIQKK